MKANRIDLAFRQARAGNRAAFMPFLTAGDPSLAATAALIRELDGRGADLIELGIPYSDPIADGPTIQSSYVRALEGGVHLDGIFAMLAGLRRECEAPILTMVSFSIVTRIGPKEYFARAAAAGADGVIIPDLPADEGAQTARLAGAVGLHPVFLVAPTTPERRMKQIARLSRGFIYCISATGVTGARQELSPELNDYVARLRRVTPKPLAVGFGVSTPDQVRTLARIADGVIVGSAIMKKVQESAGKPIDELVAAVGDMAAELAAAKQR